MIDELKILFFNRSRLINYVTVVIVNRISFECQHVFFGFTSIWQSDYSLFAITYYDYVILFTYIFSIAFIVITIFFTKNITTNKIITFIIRLTTTILNVILIIKSTIFCTTLINISITLIFFVDIGNLDNPNYYSLRHRMRTHS